MARPTSPSHENFLQVRTFGSLDGLRALSILGVLWVHAWLVSGSFERLEAIPVLRMGGFGVDIFFAISGFLITTLLLRERRKSGRISLRSFYIRRTLRIWPLYYATLAFYILLVLFSQRGTERGHVFFHYLPGYLTFTYTWFTGWFASGAIFNFAWSLSVEEQFYLLWAPVLRLLRGLWPAALMVLLIAIRVSTLYGSLWRIVPPASLLGRMAANISMGICLGVLLALALDSEFFFNCARSVLGHRWSAPCALGLLLLSLAPESSPLVDLCQAATLPLLVGACVVREDNGLAPFLRLRPVAYIGIISYGMYMLNTLTLDGLHPLLRRMGVINPVIVFPLFALMTVAVATLSYRYFESPFLKLKSRFSRLLPPAKKAEMVSATSEPC
ncbi:MAG: acyltransferase [Candidatus Acidiferrales bacterium]